MQPLRQRLPDIAPATELPDAPSFLDSVLDAPQRDVEKRLSSLLDSVIEESATPILFEIADNATQTKLDAMLAEVTRMQEDARHKRIDKRSYLGVELSDVAVDTDNGRRKCICGSYTCRIGPYIVG